MAVIGSTAQFAPGLIASARVIKAAIAAMDAAPASAA